MRGVEDVVGDERTKLGLPRSAFSTGDTNMTTVLLADTGHTGVCYLALEGAERMNLGQRG